MNIYNKKIIWITCTLNLILMSFPSLSLAFDFKKYTQDAISSKTDISLPSLKNTGKAVAGLSNTDMIAGLKDALRIGSENVVGKLGKTNGFNNDPAIRIPLPASMNKVKSSLSRVGMGGSMDELELKLNQAAEVATPKAKKIFGAAIQDMSVDDAKLIFNGPDDAATSYFKQKMTAPLRKEMNPVIEQSLAEVGAVNTYNKIMKKYNSLPFVPKASADLTGYVLDKSLSGIFHYLAEEEAGIRKDPAKRTTDILKKVFAN
jgi:hypothetical protein